MLPRCCRDLPPLTSTNQRRLDHGRCTEVLRRKPSGEGAYWWVQVRNQGLSLRQVIAAVARSVQIDPATVSAAGARDRQADVSQWLSLPTELVEHPQALRNAGYQRKLRVVDTRRHHRPMDWSQVVALDWQLRIPGAGTDDGFQRARALLDRLRRQGLPNYHPLAVTGRGQEAKWGRLLAQGRPLPAAVQRSAGSSGRLLAACQAQLFDRWLAARLDDGLFDRLLLGDVVETGCNRHPDQRAAGRVDDPAAWTPRFDSWEVVPMGPLFGADLDPASDLAGEREAAIWADTGLDKRALAKLRPGRRAMRVQPSRVQCDLDGDDLTLHCRLPCETAIGVLLEELLQPNGRLA